MAVTLYTGPPGSGKSYAMVSEVIIPAMLQGRRIVTNIDGLQVDKVREYCKEKDPTADLGEIVLFDGNDSHDPLFWPHQDLDPSLTFIKAGDLVIFDEWKLYYVESGKLQSDTVVPFIRWHRHFTDENGISCDLIIATQVAADVHRQVRGVIEKSYDFFKLSMVGFSRGYRWTLYEGRLQNKNTKVRQGNGTYKKEIFPLYSSYSEGKQGTELKTDKRSTIFGKAFVSMGVLCLVLFLVGGWGMYDFFTAGAPTTVPETPGAQVRQAATPQVPQVDMSPKWRIAGHVVAADGLRVVMQSRDGQIRYASPNRFVFDGERPVIGQFEGREVTSDEWVIVEAPQEIASANPY